MTDISKHGDVGAFLEQLKVLKKDAADKVPLDKSVGEAFLQAMQDTENLKECVNKLFPIEIPLGQPFFDQLHEFHHWIGVSESGDEALGMVWSEAMSRLSTPQQQELLELFVQQPAHDFFVNSRSIWVVVRDHHFPAEYLAEWFVKLLQVVERDIQKDVWKTIRTVCTFHHQVAVDVLKQYLGKTDERRDSVASYILGVLRSESLDEVPANKYAQIEHAYENNAEASRRAVFNWSWVATSRERELNENEFHKLQSRSERSKDDTNSIVCVFCRLLQIDCLPQHLLEQTLRWVETKLSPELSSNAKYHVVKAASRLYCHMKNDDFNCRPVNWIVAIQPLCHEERGTWSCIGDFLCDVLRRDTEEMTSTFIELCSSSAKTIHDLMLLRELRNLLHEFGNHDVDSLIAKLALSVDTETRKLGLYMFNELEIDELPSFEIESSNEVGIRSLFYESQRTILSPKAVGRILAAVVSGSKKTPLEFQGELLDELRLQCRNFSGGCMQELKRLAKDNPLVVEAMKDVENYFDALRAAHEAGINAMEVTGFRKAAREQTRRFNQQVSEGAKSESQLLSLFKQVSLLYGKSSSHYMGGILHAAMPLSHISHSMEVPIVDFLDPETMALRRLHASTMISRLLAEQENKIEDDYER